MKKNDGGPAFPCGPDGGCGPHPGMSLRDYFAGQAVVGLLMQFRTCLPDEDFKLGTLESSYSMAFNENHGEVSGDLSYNAYQIADAMLDMREVKNEKGT